MSGSGRGWRAVRRRSAAVLRAGSVVAILSLAQIAAPMPTVADHCPRATATELRMARCGLLAATSPGGEAIDPRLGRELRSTAHLATLSSRPAVAWRLEQGDRVTRLAADTLAESVAVMTRRGDLPPTDAPSTASLTDDALPPPPPSFDPCSITYVGSSYGMVGETTDEAWISCLDGSDAWLAFPDGNPGLGATPSGRLLWTTRNDDDTVSLWVGRPGSSERQLLSDYSGARALSADGRTVFASRATGNPDDPDGAVDRGYWRVPLDGSRPGRVMPPSTVSRMVGVVGPRERSFATGYGSKQLIDDRHATEARFPDGSIRRIRTGRPIGIDARGILYVRRGAATMYRHWNRSYRRMPLTQSQQVSVLPGGRFLLIGLREEGQHRLRDVLTGTSRRLALAKGYWTSTELSTRRYLVLQDYADGRFAVVDLEEGWLGYLPALSFEAPDCRWSVALSAGSDARAGGPVRRIAPRIGSSRRNSDACDRPAAPTGP